MLARSGVRRGPCANPTPAAGFRHGRQSRAGLRAPGGEARAKELGSRAHWLGNDLGECRLSFCP